MSAYSIIEHFDPFKNILLGIFPCRVTSVMHELCFNVWKNFHDGIVVSSPVKETVQRRTSGF